MKSITEDQKRRIADLYQHTNMSIGAIAQALNLSKGTIQKYKDLKLNG